MSVVSSPRDEVALADLLSDGLFVDGDWVESKDQDPDGDVRLIQLADVGDGVFRDRSSRFLTSEKAKELRCTFLEPGDVLVARMPEPLGRACIFPGVGQPAVTAVDVCI
ncbi:restriction endonuclease subunit S, partial [Mycobacteroides abscessus]|nr:restriction endonuclease subunit S [Mycobacteroides abscessus]MDM2069175.1 restriction endonuclease subunit S [Mycobacteroides abscessus]MDM2078500.1 restriction endonuclease subunit S [Mycobacteroides abscessus]